MVENKATSSIARRLNLDFWGRLLGIFISLDIVIGFLIAGSFWYYEERYALVLEDFLLLFKYPVIIVLSLEALVLLENLFKTRKIRRTLKPLNDMAKKAEELSSIASDTSKFLNLENAISNLKPDAPNAKVVTGDKDLYSLEIAINNLLDRMRESYRQQNRFVSDASHELRTPIAVIQGYVNMLDRWGKEDESILDESIEALKNESQRMKELVEQLLFLARGDSGRNTLKIEEFILSDIVREVYEESMMIDEHHVYHFSGEEGIIMKGDLAMVKQSVRVFADNAAKYSNQGDTIILGVKKDENHVCYSVQDEGMGMAENEVVHVFERFYRADGARNSKKGGTGLGLSIARWIVEAHGGIIEILSRPEFGTRFTVKFPVENFPQANAGEGANSIL